MLNKVEYLLTCLSEECAEAQQLVSKSLRFGLDSHYPQDNERVENYKKLKQEINDIYTIVAMLENEGVFGTNSVYDVDIVHSKHAKVKQFMEISKELGILEYE